MIRGFSILLFSLVLGAKAPEWDRAHELYQRTDYTQALATLEGIPNKGADDLQLIGQCHLMQGDYKKATEAFEKALALAPQSSELHRLLGNAYGRRAETASVFTAPGYARKAHQYFEQAVDLDPSNREAVANLFEYYLEAPGIMGGGIDKAESLVKRLAVLDPSAAHHAQAQLERKRNRYEAAEEQLRRAAELAPRQAGRVVDLAKFLADRGRIKESDEKFTEAARLSPDSPAVLYARAETYIKQQRNLKDARRLLERYLESQLTPDDPTREDARALLAKIGR